MTVSPFAHVTDHSEGFSSIEPTSCDESHLDKATSSHPRLVPFAGTCLPSGVMGGKPTCQALSKRWAHSVREEPWAFCMCMSSVTSCACASPAIGNSSPLGLTPLPHLTAGGSCLLGCSHALETVQCLPGLLHAGPMLGPSAVGLVMFKLGLFWGEVYRTQT